MLAAAPGARPALPARVAVKDLGAYPLVLPSPPNAIRTLVDSVCRAQGVRLQVAAEVDAVQTIVELAAQGDACAILPRSAARGPAAEHALALADIVAPASSTTWCWRPPATVPRRGWPRPPPN